ncbi:sensor histidine kinase [Burkholderia alba]|uniref:sensor histidine kinase n=1 Tax=Burkholderia alba TaxID=2683677 RepID=UPI002B05EDC2|nr:histidine kinase dimerization/phospho-acceptor domain-containing protein [Burkholderia alba]
MTSFPADPAAALLRERAAHFAAEAALFMRDQVLSTASHDLRGPLNAMHSWAFVLERQLAHADAGLQRALAGIRTGIEQQTRLVEAVVDAPRAATRALALHPTDVSPAEVAAHGAALARAALADARGVRIAVTVGDGAGNAIAADGARLAQAIFTMLVFAVEAGAPQCAVTLACANEGDAVRFDATFPARPAALTDPTLPHVFEPFARQEAQRERDGKHCAWVLALCQRVAQAHGGAFAQGPLADGAPATLSLTVPRVTAR